MNFLNNTFVTLEAGVRSSERLIFAKKFVGNLGDKFPITAMLSESDESGKVIKREVVRITGRNDKILNVDRAVEACPQSDDAENPTQNALNFSENAILYHTLSAGDLTSLESKIDGKLSKNQMRSGLSSNGFLVVEDGVEKITTGLPTSVIASVFNARAITEIAENNEFLLRKWNATEKINYPNFRNDLVKKFAKNPTSIPSANEYWNGDHWWNAIAVPNGGFFSLTAARGSSSSGSTHLMYSPDNNSDKSRWENVASVSASRPGDQWILGTTSGFCKPGFYRKKIYNQGYSGDDSVATIQIF